MNCVGAEEYQLFEERLRECYKRQLFSLIDGHPWQRWLLGWIQVIQIIQDWVEWGYDTMKSIQDFWVKLEEMVDLRFSKLIRIRKKIIFYK